MTILDRIKLLASKRNTTIKELSEIIGLSENSIYKWKSAKPKGEDLAKIADYFHVTVDYLLGREDITDEDVADIIDRSSHFDGREYPNEVKEGMKDVLRAYLLGKLGPEKKE